MAHPPTPTITLIFILHGTHPSVKFGRSEARLQGLAIKNVDKQARVPTKIMFDCEASHSWMILSPFCIIITFARRNRMCFFASIPNYVPQKKPNNIL
jgi:hypothetical protein